jgi:hypothetical protein
MTIKEVNEKFVRGRDGLTEGDLTGLLSLYKDTLNNLENLDSDFTLFKNEARRRYNMLLSFKEARKDEELLN